MCPGWGLARCRYLSGFWREEFEGEGRLALLLGLSEHLGDVHGGGVVCFSWLVKEEYNRGRRGAPSGVSAVRKVSAGPLQRCGGIGRYDCHSGFSDIHGTGGRHKLSEQSVQSRSDANYPM